jgi:hypothetical protein
MFGKRNVRTAANYQMVQHTYVHELTFDNAFGDFFVGSARFCTPEGDYARGSRGGIHFDGFAYNFSRMHLNVAKSTRKKAAMFQHPVLIIEKDHHKDLALLSVSWLCRNSASSLASGSDLPSPCGHCKTAGQLGNPLSWAYFATPIPSTCLNCARSAVSKAVQRTKMLISSCQRKYRFPAFRYVKRAPAAHHPLTGDAVAQHFSRGSSSSSSSMLFLLLTASCHRPVGARRPRFVLA